MNKKLTTLLITLIAALLLVACAPAAAPTDEPAVETDEPVAAEETVETEEPADTEEPAATDETTSEPEDNGLSEFGLPDYYPAAYREIIEGSQQEMETVSDGLLVYSIMGESNWAPILAAFYAKYPWMDGKVTALDLGSYEVFERYYSEAASGARTGDMIITSTPDGWQQFIADGHLAEYTSPEDAHVPDWSKLAPGIYAASSDPMIIIYNKQLVAEPPDSMADIAALIEANPDTTVTTYDAEKNATGFAINWFWAKDNGDAGWDMLTTIGQTKPTRQTSAGNMVNAVLAGEAAVGYFVSAISVLPKYPDAEPVMGYSYIHDGQPILVRGMGVTAAAEAPNSAKLLMDFILSGEGQLSLAAGGLTAYREDIADQVDYHLSAIEAEVGAENLIFFWFDPELLDQAVKDAFIAQWNETILLP